MDLEIITDIVNNYDPAFLGVLAVSFPVITGLVSYYCVKQVYSNFKNKKRNEKLVEKELLSSGHYGGYEI